MNDCTSLIRCAASLCPKDKESLAGVFFPDEEVCTQFNEPWIRRQRKIKNKTRNFDTCYTHKMLSKNITIGKAIKGIDPDKEREIEENKWLNKHPERKNLTKEQKEKLSERMSKIQSKKGVKTRGN